MNENENKYLSLKTAAGLYGYTRDHLGLMIRQGKLKGIKLGSYYVTTNEWVSDYLKKYADPGRPLTKGKFSNKFLTQAFAAKDPAMAGRGGAKKAKKETKSEKSQSSVQNKFNNDFFSEIQKELSPSLREWSSVQGKNSVSSISSVVSYVNSGNPYVILPIRKMEESERKDILKKISGCDKSKDERGMV